MTSLLPPDSAWKQLPLMPEEGKVQDMSRRRTYVYVAGPYTGQHTHDHHSYFAIHQNIANAHEAGLQLARLGYGYFCPHTHSAHNEVIAPDIPFTYWYELDLHFLRACDAMLVLPGESRGVELEKQQCAAWGIPVFSSIEDLAHNLPKEVRV